MRGPLAASIAGALVATAGVSALGQTPRFRAATQTVSLYVTALEPGGRLVPGLTRDDFEVRDDGVVQELTAFSNDIQPISMAVMLDMSSSMTSNLPLLRTGAAQLFAELLPADQVRVGSFASRIIISSDFSNDRDALIRALYLDLPQSGETALWSAINIGMNVLSKTAGRRVVLVFTDGYDTTKLRPTLNDVMGRAQAEEFMVYGIGLRGLSRDGLNRTEPPDPGLQVLATQSGGGYFELSTANDLSQTFKVVADELHQQYLLGFQTSWTDGKIHPLEVRVKKPGVTPRARKSYLAPKAPGGNVAGVAMITRAVLVVALTVAVAAATPAGVERPALSGVDGQDQQPTQFRAGVRTVPVYVSVRTHAGEFVLDLAQQDFVVLDNGKPQEITTFTKDVQPLSVVILIDGSTSVVPILKSVLDAANQFIIRMMPGDKGRVGSFADRVRLMPRFSSNRDELLSYIADEFNIRVANATRLWDGVMDSLDALNGTDGRRVVLVLSDGFDTNSSSSAGNVMSAARKYDAIVYAVAVWTHEGAAQIRPNRYMEGVATETGGGFFEMRPNDDMNAATTRISEELHNQYVIGFTPQVLDGKVHKLEVKLKQPDLLVVARKSYVAEDRKK